MTLSSHWILKKSLISKLLFQLLLLLSSHSCQCLNQEEEPAPWLKIQGPCLLLALLFYYEDLGIGGISTLAPGHYLLRSPWSVRARPEAYPSHWSRRQTTDGSSIFRSWDVAHEWASDLEEATLPPVCFWLPCFPSLSYQNFCLGNEFPSDWNEMTQS